MTNINPSRPNNLPAKIGVGVLVVIIFLAVVVYAKNQKTSDVTPVANEQTTNTETSANTNTPAANTNKPTNTSTNTAANTNTSTPAKSPYKNGTYSAVGTYTAPSGKEEVAVSVTLVDGKITTSTVTKQTTNPTSSQFQGEFISNYKQFVTGKDISTLKLSKVSGSSLTPHGFNNAIEQIKAQATI